MLNKLKQRWQTFRALEPGKRFQCHYQQRHPSADGPVRKVLFIGGGVLIMAAGVVFLAIPGPGILVLFIGAGMIAQESLATARVLDWLEVRLRRLAGSAWSMWTHASGIAKVLLVAVCLLVGLAVVYAGYLMFIQGS